MAKFTVVSDRLSKKMFMRLVSDEPSDILFALGEDPTLPHLISRDALLELIYELTRHRSANKGQRSNVIGAVAAGHQKSVPRF
jgi:hypothetical protein